MVIETRRRGRLSVGIEIREVLLKAGARGAVCADLFRTLPMTTSSYHTFNKYFYLLRRLNFIEATGKTEESSKPGLKDRVFYRLTIKGRQAPIHQWSSPMRTFYDLVHQKEGAWRDYWHKRRPPTRRQPGRPSTL